ncbi:NAD(P)H-dependent oxidoreductase [Maribacter algarum]|uniref:NAD(P)H-dependent oxidoreductase n=1 Tax=Maribacter algarum (ex Zhang et al. 2020) TaxID=2578118 RepID=A0A5S3PRU5_9FLAO|nr:NAD(P)H-dependent oxidoreductase [Maribacter algarum]TMM57460.1 NAD(P)H-dependent oxidoreductase [Maribacter algarum]
MKVLIIYCHPSRKSYTYEILEQLKSSLERNKLEYEVSDLYDMGFEPDMNEKEYEREGFGNTELPVPQDVYAEHQKINKADCLIFVYPVWWSDCPAKLKGWFDRVYAVGYAYDSSKEKEIGQMKIIKYGLVICTAGYPNSYLEQIGIAESMRKVMVEDRLGGRFRKKDMVLLGGTLDKSRVRSKHSKIVESIGEKIKKIVS